MKEQERLAFEDGRAYERARIVTELVDALDRYRESIEPDQHYTSQRSAMQDAIAYATVFIVKPMGKMGR